MSAIDTPSGSSRPGDPSSEAEPQTHAHPRRAFVTTQWSVVLKAGRHDTARAQKALAALCQTYWYPLYAHVRRRGYSSHDAQDLTQEFFARLLEKQAVAAATPDRGRFRSFLLTSLNNFLATEWQKSRTQKRGGTLTMISLDGAAAAERYALEPADGATPDTAFDRRWALELLETVLQRLELEYVREGKADLFAALQGTLVGAGAGQPYARLAESLGLSEGGIKVAVHRLRKRYRELVRAEIADTVATPEEVNLEMRHLLELLS